MANDMLSRIERLEQENHRLKRWRTYLVTGNLIGGLVLVATIYGTKSFYDEMRNTVTTKGLKIVSDDGNILMTMVSTKEKGSWLTVRDTQDFSGGRLTGSRRLMMGVMPNGLPRLLMMQESSPPGDLFMKPGPIGIALGLRAEYPELMLSSPGKAGIYLGTGKPPVPTIEISNPQGETVFKTP